MRMCGICCTFGLQVCISERIIILYNNTIDTIDTIDTNKRKQYTLTKITN